MAFGQRRVAIFTLGSRGDVQPFCVLARELADRGVSVRLAVNPDYRSFVESFGIQPVDLSATPLDAVFHTESFRRLHGASSKKRIDKGLLYFRDFKRAVDQHFVAMVETCRDQMRDVDLAIYNPLAFFVGELARRQGIPSVRVSSQPTLPSWRVPISFFGWRDLGSLLNRATYEVPRLTAPLLFRRAFATMQTLGDERDRLHSFTNPLTLAMRRSHQLLAFSPTLSPDPGDWPVPHVRTGFWHREPRPGTTLPEAVSAFLSAGPPPILVGFGSMAVGTDRNTKVVLEALRIWGGRAILARGAGGLRPPADLPPNILQIGQVDHALLLPRVSAVVHHGGSGTTGAALRHGRPAVICPILGDQLYWGRCVAAAGAAEEPVPLRRITAEELAVRIGRACQDGPIRAAAQQVAAAMAREPGVAAAADYMESLIGRTPTALAS